MHRINIFMKEREIRPRNLHQTILKLSKQDTARFILPRKRELKRIACPACGTKEHDGGFKKFGMEYAVCRGCKSIYLSPRPTEKHLSKVYNRMKSVKFWETGFYKETAEARREKIFTPRAAKVVETARKWLGSRKSSPTLMDVGSGYGIFLEEARKIGYFKDIVGIEPTSTLAKVCRQRGFEVLEQWITDRNVKDIERQADVLTCFEVLEHIHDPLKFVKTFTQLLAPGGIFILSFPSASGLDVQLLGEKSNTVYPPHHINILTVEGVRMLAERAGLRVAEITTPGKLDVDIVKNALQEGGIEKTDGFFKYIFWRNDEKLLADLQKFCSDNLLSSHLFLVLRKK